MERMYTVPEVARLLGFTRITIIRYIREGKIKAIKIAFEGKGHWRIKESEINRIQEGK